MEESEHGGGVTGHLGWQHLTRRPMCGAPLSFPTQSPIPLFTLVSLLPTCHLSLWGHSKTSGVPSPGESAVLFLPTLPARDSIWREGKPPCCPATLPRPCPALGVPGVPAGHRWFHPAASPLSRTSLGQGANRPFICCWVQRPGPARLHSQTRCRPRDGWALTPVVVVVVVTLASSSGHLLAREDEDEQGTKRYPVWASRLQSDKG